MRRNSISKGQRKGANRLLTGKQAVNNFQGTKINKIQNIFGAEGIKILKAKPEHLDWFNIQKTDDMENLYNIKFSLISSLGENVEKKVDLDYTKKPIETLKAEDRYRYRFIHGPKELEEQVGKLENMEEKEEIKYKLEWRELVKKAHNDFNTMFPPEKFTFAFFGSFLNFAKGKGDYGYNTLPGDLDADADISQFGQYVFQMRKNIKAGGDIVDPQITGTGKGYPKLVFYNDDNKEINIFEEELTAEEITNILKKTLEKKENKAFYGALRMTRKTGSKNTKLQIENEIYFNMKGKGLTQISNKEDALTQVERDTILIKIDGKLRRYLNARAQTRLYAMNLIYEADTNTVKEYAKTNDGEITKNSTFKGMKLASRIQKIGELNPGLSAYRLIPLLLKVRLSFIMQAKENNGLTNDKQDNFDEYIEKSLDPYLSGAITTDKLRKSIGFDQKSEELFRIKNKEEIEKDKEDLILNTKDAQFIYISVKYPKVAELVEKARADRSISIAESAYTLLTKACITETPNGLTETHIYLLNWILRKNLDLKDLQNIELVEKMQPMPTHTNSIGDKLVKFYALRDKFLEKKYKNILVNAEKALIHEGFQTKQQGSLIKFLERYMKEFGESYTTLQDKIKKIQEKTGEKAGEKAKGEIEDLKKESLAIVKVVEGQCINLANDLENLIVFSLKTDTIRSFALYSAGIDVRDAYIDPVRTQISRIKEYLQLGILPGNAGSLRDLFPQDTLEDRYSPVTGDKNEHIAKPNTGQRSER